MVRAALIPMMLLTLVLNAGAGTPVLRVNGQAITDAEYELTRNAMAAQMGAEEASPDNIARSALDQLIARVLLVQAAKEAGIKAPDGAVDEEMKQQVAAMGGQEAFASAVAGAGLTEADVRQAQEDRMIMLGLVETVLLPRIEVTREAARAFWSQNPDEFRHPEQIRLWMMLVDADEGSPEGARAGARAKAEAARQRVLAGEDFATVARDVSDDPSRERGGLIGWVRQGLLLPELEEPVFALAAGGVSQVLQSRRGYHLFRVEERRPAGVYPFEEIGDQLIEILRQERLGEAVAEEVSRRRRTATIEVLDPSLRPYMEPPAAAAPPQ